MMAKFLKELYLTAFTILYRAGQIAWPPRVSAWIGVAGIALFEMVILIGIASSIAVFFETKILLSLNRWAAYIAYVLLCYINYLALVAREDGIKFDRAFKSLAKSKRTRLLLSCLALMLLTIVLFLFTAARHREHIKNEKPRTFYKSEQSTPTKAPEVPMNLITGAASQLRTLHDSKESSPTSH